MDADEKKALQARIAELEATCAGHYANTVEALRQANEADARAAELENALADCVDLAEWWINHKREPGMCERDYRTWLSLGHRSDILLKAKAAIDAARGKT